MTFGLLRGMIKSCTTKGLREAVRTLVREYRFSRRHLTSSRKARRMKFGLDCKLNLGCGTVRKEGWINIDLLSDKADFHLDLREGLPFPDDSVDVIYSEHFLEHIGYPDEALKLLQESLRVLKPGGLFSVGVPNPEKLLKAYAQGDVDYIRQTQERWHPSWCNTPMHHINYLFRQGDEHKYSYDFETLARVLEEAGFTSISQRAFDPSTDSEYRRHGTLYVNAFKPGKPHKESN